MKTAARQTSDQIAKAISALGVSSPPLPGKTNHLARDHLQQTIEKRVTLFL